MKCLIGVRVAIPLIMLLTAILACDVPGTAPKMVGNLGATETMRALSTVVAGTLEPASKGGEESSESAPPGTSEDESAESNPSPTISPTPTLGPPLVSVSANTNCRFGPGDVYDYLGALMVGEEALITGKLADESYWYIENPDAPPPYCWIWGMYASVSGDKSGIPVLTPPPTPTPANSPTPTLTHTPTPDPMDFVAIYQKFDIVNGRLFVRIKNTGSVDLESFSYTVHVPQTGHTNSGNIDYFADTPVSSFTHVDKISPGAHEYVFMSGLQSVNGPMTFEITIKICTEDGLGGYCEQTYLEETIQIP